MDEMLNLGFRTQITNILSLLPGKRQNLLFSATITDEVEKLMNDYFTAPERVEAAPTGSPVENIIQTAYHVPNFNTKVNLLELLLASDETMTKVLIFVSTKSLADQLYKKLSEQFPEIVGVIHSNKEQNYRFNTVKQFKAGVFKYIIATDVMARGIDVAKVTHVINFDTPEVPENYIHRIGRTGRADKEGTAISFISPNEEEIQIQAEILMEKEIDFIEFPKEVEVATRLLEFEKDRKKVKQLLKKVKQEGGAAFHEKSKKNQKVNLGGPGKVKPRKTESRNRGVERKRDAKRKKK